MNNQADTPEDSLERFKAAFRADIEAEAVRTVADYVEAFPGISNDIALEYADWKRATSTKEGHIGPYRIERELGRGGQAVVFLCDDERLRRKVAVKVLLGLGGASEETLTRFRREAGITSQLDHPGICALYETGIGPGGAPWIAMRYVEGQPLSTVLAETRQGDSDEPTSMMVDFSIVSGADDDGAESATTSPTTPTTQVGRRDMDRLLIIVEKVARALHVAHESGIVHRDIKPGNIMVTAGGQPVVLDFGLASADEGGQPTVTRSGELMGTPAYMSPEQIAAQRITLDRRTDIWSLGVTLYECLTLKRPFEAPSREGLYRQILTKEPDDVRRINPAIPAELGIVLSTAMDKDADRRYATAEEFADDLQRVRELKPIAAQPMSALLRTRRWAQRNPAIATMMAAVFLLITTVAVVMFVKNRELDRSNSALTTKTEEATENANKATANAEKARRNMELAERNLAEAQRLADVKKLAEARSEVDELWPLGKDLPPRIAAFRDKYSEMIGRLPQHEATLAKLESEALPYSPDDQAADHGETRSQLAALTKKAADLEAGIDELPDVEFDEAEARLESIAVERESLEAELSLRKTWRFAGKDADYKIWMREVLSDLVQELRSFTDQESGALADLSERERRSNELVRETLTEVALSWRQCSARILTNPKYVELSLSPQEGLIPLGPDPDSSFEEFLHWASHAEGHPIPQRDAAGKLPQMDGETGIILVLLPGGSFTMGATRDPSGPNYDPEARLEEGPPHEVRLSAFFLGKYEVTRGQWVRISGRGDPSFWVAATTGGRVQPSAYPLHPAEQVSWLDCNTFLTRSGLLLPTEARWEYGCRAGTSTPWSFGSEMGDFVDHANLADESYKSGFDATGNASVPGLDDGHAVTAPVGHFGANDFGLHDLHGNVWEWCLDLYGPYTGTHAPNDGLLQQGGGSGHRVSQGGSFSTLPIGARSSYRSPLAESLVSYNLGARAAREVTP